MAVVAALEFDDLVAAGKAARQTDALMVASVPEFTMRTMSMLSISEVTSSAMRTSISVGAPKLSPRSTAAITASRIAGWL